MRSYWQRYIAFHPTGVTGHNLLLGLLEMSSNACRVSAQVRRKRSQGLDPGRALEVPQREFPRVSVSLK